MVKRADMNLAESLLLQRQRRHWTRKEVAERLGVGQVSIYRWETGRTTPRPHELRGILALYETTLDEIVAPQPGVWMVPFLRNRYFTGRVDILDQIHTALTSSSPIAVICQRDRASATHILGLNGLGGIGKTQIAVEYAHRHKLEHHVVLWALGESRRSLLAAFAEIAARLGLPDQGETDELSLALAVKERLETREERNWLLIVDNADDLALLKEFLPTRSMRRNGAMLVTTRQGEVGKYMTRIAVDTFSLNESVQFLLRRVSDARGQRLADLPESERQAAFDLATLMDGLPLALDQAAAYVEKTGCSLAEYVTWFQARRDAFLREGSAVDAREYPDSVATTWRVSFRQIQTQHPAAAELLRLCAYLAPDAIPVDMVTAGAAALGPVLAPVAASPAELHGAIEALRGYSLVKRHKGKSAFSVHRLVQAVLQDEQMEDERREWARRALLVVDAAFPEAGPDNWAQCARLIAQASHVAQSIEHYQLYSVEAGRVLYRTALYLQARGQNKDPIELERLYRLALHIVEEELGPDHAWMGDNLLMLGINYLGKGQYAEAERYCLLASRIFELQSGPEHAFVADALSNLGCVYEEQGKLAEAETVYQRALTIYQASYEPRHDKLAVGMLNLASVFREQARYAEAESLYQQALDIWSQLFGLENPRLAYPFAGLADIHREQGAYAAAEPLYQRALAIWEQVDELYAEIRFALPGLAEIYREEGRYAEAEQCYRRLLTIYERRGQNHPMIAAPLAGLASLRLQRQQYAEAQALLRRAQRVCAQVDDRYPARMETLFGLARLHEAQGDFEEARAAYERVLALQERSLGARHPRTTETRERLCALPLERA